VTLALCGRQKAPLYWRNNGTLSGDKK